MFLRSAAFALALAALPAACSPTPPERQEPAPSVPQASEAAPIQAAQGLPESFARGQAEFGLALYRELGAKPGNLFLSPVSLSTALAMVYAGAEGETASEMARALRFPASRTHDEAGALLRALPVEGEARRLSIANALWVQAGFPLKPAFTATMHDRYRGDAQPVDFIDAPEAAVTAINRWAEQQTAGRIRGLIQRENVTDRTRLVLTNAVYFKADWLSPFQAVQTRLRPFRLAGSGAIEVPMMRQRGRFRLLDEPAFEAVEMPYKGEEFSMMVFLPKAGSTLGAFEAELGADRLGQRIEALRAAERADIELVVPKLELDTRGSMVPVLQALGMRRAFSDQAQLRGIADADLRISDVIHQTWLRVDEKGAEAAAATGALAEIVSMPRPFHADRPFFFVIRDNRTGTLLFIGRIERPTPPSKG